jgi:hypothetical protein
MIMLGWTEGEQYSGKEISEMLREAGFANIQVRPTFGYWGLVTAQKLGRDSMSVVNSHLKVMESKTFVSRMGLSCHA